MAITIDTTSDGIQGALQGVFDKIESDFGKLSYVDVLTETHRELEAEASAMFGSGKDPAGKAWEPLKESTRARKGHAKVLIDTNRLRRSLASRTGDSIREVISEPGTSHGLSFGTSVPYSIFHQGGTARAPVRKHVGTNREYVTKLSRKVATRTVKKLQERQR